MVFRKSIELGLDVVAVNGTSDPATLVHLVKYDSVHGNGPFQSRRQSTVVS